MALAPPFFLSSQNSLPGPAVFAGRRRARAGAWGRTSGTPPRAAAGPEPPFSDGSRLLVRCVAFSEGLSLVCVCSACASLQMEPFSAGSPSYDRFGADILPVCGSASISVLFRRGNENHTCTGDSPEISTRRILVCEPLVGKMAVQRRGRAGNPLQTPTGWDRHPSPFPLRPFKREDGSYTPDPNMSS